jgi:small subunit ribosomal protein S2
VAAKGGNILFVGTKKQAQDVVEAAAKECNMFHVRNRWLGGLLTNFQTVKKSVERLKSIEKMGESGMFDKLTKKEVARFTKEKDKLSKDLEGIRNMGGHPTVMVLIDSKKEEIAVKEARRLKIPVVALIDTNCDPDEIDYPIPGNDDALKSISLITSLLVESILEGRKIFMTGETAAAKAKAQEEASGEPAVIGVDLETYEETVADVTVENHKIVKAKLKEKE